MVCWLFILSDALSTLSVCLNQSFRHAVTDAVTPIWNVMGVIPGHIHDEIVIVGCHRDGAFLFSVGVGAMNPISNFIQQHGYAMLLQALSVPIQIVLQVMGAADPTSGTTALVQVVRGLGALLRKGWKPLRTIIIANWDAEEVCKALASSLLHLALKLRSSLR
jgi:N-acetylated-alpha-linked acidic dipeptidase